MPAIERDYLIIGGGAAGAAAIGGIRDIDGKGSITLLSSERSLPYDRPPLSKKLWFGRMEMDDIFPHDPSYYEKMNAELVLGRTAEDLDPLDNTVTDDQGNEYRFRKLLLATGASPRPLPIRTGDLPGLCYYRTLSDYRRIRPMAAPGKSAVVIGSGFIGSEMTAALTIAGAEVTMVYPSLSLCEKVLPREMGKAMEEEFGRRGVRILNGRRPTFFEQRGERIRTMTDRAEQLESDIVIVGAGIAPSLKLATAARLETDDGIVVDEFLRTSREDIYAAGDNACFPYQVLGRRMRVEHWDNAVNQGKTAGRNMAGSCDPYTYMPYFFSDLFDFGYEALGEVSTELEITEYWRETYKTGLIYYTRAGKVRGVMMCNIWNKLDDARELIRRRAEVARELIAA